jgi:predicted nucleic acid-binding protein
VTLYVDSSALVKLYLSEPESEQSREFLTSDPVWVSAAHTLVEVRRALQQALREPQLRRVRDTFARDWSTMDVVELDEATCSRGAEIAERTGVRTLDALHLAAAQRAGGDGLTFVTFDRRQAAAARSLGWTVVPGTD